MTVFKRLRKETELQFLKSAQDLQVAVTLFMMRDKNVPKKWRLIIAQPIIAKVDELLDNINFANAIYPTMRQEYLLRAQYQTTAICNCWQLHNKLVRALICVQSVKIEKLESIIELLTRTEGLLKRWKKSDKMRYKSFVE